MIQANAWGTWVSFAVLWGAAACTGHSDAQSTTPGSGGAGGSGHTPPAQAGLTANVGQVATLVNGMTCPVSAVTYQIGAPTAPTATDPGISVISGDAGSSISCSVSSQSPFSFSGTVRGTTSAGDIVDIAFSNGSVGSDDSGTADVAWFSPQLAANFMSHTPCAIGVVNQQIKGGSLWATFDCPQIASPPSGLCQLTGVVVLENCAAP